MNCSTLGDNTCEFSSTGPDSRHSINGVGTNGCTTDRGRSSPCCLEIFTLNLSIFNFELLHRFIRFICFSLFTYKGTSYLVLKCSYMEMSAVLK